MNLSWTGSTDAGGVTGYEIERCQGTGCTTFTLLKTVTTTTTSDTGLTPNTTYSYRVRAKDATPNYSNYSNTATATTPAAAPTRRRRRTRALLATAAGTTVNLSWTGSTDAGGVTGYEIERCQGTGCTTFTLLQNSRPPPQPATPASPPTPPTATASAPKTPPPTTATTATPPPPPPPPRPTPTPPTNPSALSATAAGTTVNLSWTARPTPAESPATKSSAAREPAAPPSRCSKQSTTTTTSDTGLTPNTTYSYRVRAKDATPNYSNYSNTATATTPAAGGSSLVAAYGFEAGSGVSVVDASGNGRTGTVANAAWSAAGKFGKALSFNGSSSRVTVADAAALRLTSGMTLEAWVRPAVAATGWRDIVYKGNDNYYLEASSANGNRPVGGAIIGSSQTQAFGTAPLAVNSWVYLVETFDGSTLRFYVNGAQVSSVARTGALMTSSNPLQIGSDSIYGQYFNGLIDEVRIYNTALSAAQIQTDMTTPVEPSTPPPPDTTPPTNPSALSATAAGTTVNLSWTGSTDAGGVTGYEIERCQGTGCTTFTLLKTVPPPRPAIPASPPTPPTATASAPKTPPPTTATTATPPPPPPPPRPIRRRRRTRALLARPRPGRR